MTDAPTTEPAYPVQFSVDYPDRELDRLTTAFRIFTAIPIAIVLALISAGGVGGPGGWGGEGRGFFLSFGAGGGLLVLAPLVMILFRQKYPRWWFDWNLNLVRFENRVAAYLFLLRDEYPSTDEEQQVHVDFPYPDVPNDLNRWLPLVKWLLAIPHLIILVFLALAALVVVIIAWFAILFTGRYPEGLFDFVVGVMRWGNRVQGYAFVLITDRYPPFSLNP
ncbi:MAG: DUF4389 domain-containing protein [Chloroflexi bacterium]|jgi:hypothetical protein|nr:MAG: DUF4389 domain-containing protein [Chloroflexota bacterium]